MRRAFRILVNVAAGLSLVVFVAVCGVWVRSYFVGDGFVWKPGDAPGYYRAYVGRGVVRVGSGRYDFDREPYFDYSSDPEPSRQTGYHPGTMAHRLGFDFHRGRDSKGMASVDVIFPVWAMAVTAGVLPVAWVWGGRRGRVVRRRAGAGLCVGCGYDLRATPGRCPECGAGVG